MHPKHSGMTLIEVLVASVILFSTLTLMTNVMSTALKSSEKAEENIAISLSIPLVKDHILFAIKNGTKSESNITFNNINVSWHALNKNKLEIIKSFMEEDNSKGNALLFEVFVSLNYEGFDREIQYLEFDVER